MAETTLATTTLSATGTEVVQWSLKYFKEYVRDERFARYTGESPNNVFQVVKDLTKKAGDRIVCPLITRLTGAAVLDDDTLEGNEESLGNYADYIQVQQQRKAVSRGNHEQSKSNIDILDAARYMLKKWSMEQLRDAKIDALQSPVISNGLTTAYADATEAEKDTWDTNQSDRVLYGDLESNRSAGDHSAGLLNVDTTADTLDTGIIAHLRRIAESADPHITPISVGEDEEWFVAFTGTDSFRDLAVAMDTVHQNAGPRSLKENPIFRDGDLVYQNVIVRKIPEMASVGTVGASSAPVYVVAFCGAQAVGVAWSEMTQAIMNGKDGQDYGNIRGTGVKETRGVKKFYFNNKQHGMVTGYVAAAADS